MQFSYIHVFVVIYLSFVLKFIPELDKLPRDSFSYASMIDAGSSGSRVHVYRYGKLGSKDGELYVLPSHVSFKEKPGLSSFASNPKEAPQTLMALIEFIKKFFCC